MIHENWVILGAFINFLGGISYIKDTLSGKIKPNRVSWGLWAFVVFIAFAAEIHQGVGIQSITTLMFGITPLLIFLASFVNKKAYWAITKFDIFCGVLAILGVLLWITTKNADWAIAFAIFADLMAGVPTLVKSFYHPETENWIEFSSSFISSIILLLTLSIWQFEYYGFPLYILLFDLTTVILIKYKIGPKFNFARRG